MIKVYCNISKSTIKKVNKKINDYLDMYMDFYTSFGPDEGFSSLFPKSVWIENKDQCIEAMINLDVWTKDNFYHTLQPIHEYSLYKILSETKQLHLDDGIKKELEEYCDKHDETNLDDYILRDLDNIDLYFEILFQDFDFLSVSDYLEYYFQDPYKFEKEIDVNLDNYVTLMPNDIRNKYFSIKEHLYPKDIITSINKRIINNKEDLLYHIDKIIEYFSHSITLKNAYKLLWNDNKVPKKEKSAQQLFGFISGFYCEKNNIDYTPEAETGRGPVDFKFSFGNDLKVIAEIKLGSNNLIHGLENQTVQYMLSEKVDTAYFVVIILNDNEIKKLDNIVETTKKVNQKHNLHIKPIIIDARLNKPSASLKKLKGDSIDLLKG